MKINKKIMKKNSYFISINYKHGIYNIINTILYLLINIIISKLFIIKLKISLIVS